MTASQSQGWDVLTPIAQDASARRYTRMQKNGRTAILMEAGTEKDSLPAFISISEWLNSAGLKAPQIYEGDAASGLLLLEDFGDISFKTALKHGQDASMLYGLAADVLKHLQTQKKLPALPFYSESNVHKGHRRVIDWYVPALLRQKNPDGMVESYLGAWREIESALPPCPQGFVHGDYHLENLMWIGVEKGIKRCGILDFQGAMLGPAPYDLANLLEDARTDVPAALREKILGQYDEEFCLWYRVLATQFHCRVIGQFIKMALVQGKPGYLAHLPRLAAYINEGLESPVLEPLKNWFAAEVIVFTGRVDAADAHDFIRPDAF